METSTSSQTTELHVEGMSCGHCKAKVEKGLGELAGVTQVEVSLENKSVRVTGTASIDSLKATIDDLGYEVV